MVKITNAEKISKRTKLSEQIDELERRVIQYDADIKETEDELRELESYKNHVEQKIEGLKEQLREIGPKVVGDFHYISEFGNIVTREASSVDGDCRGLDEALYDTGNYFDDHDDAVKFLRIMQARKKLLDAGGHCGAGSDYPSTRYTLAPLNHFPYLAVLETTTKPVAFEIWFDSEAEINSATATLTNAEIFALAGI